MSSNRGHRAGQCALEVPRTGIRARGDLQERNGCVSRCQLPLFPVPIPVFPSTKTLILCSKRPKMGGSECKKRTKMGLLCAFLFREAAHCGPRCLRLALGTAQLWSNHLRPALRLASGLVANEPTACEPTVCRADRLRSQPPAGLEA